MSRNAGTGGTGTRGEGRRVQVQERQDQGFGRVFLMTVK